MSTLEIIELVILSVIVISLVIYYGIKAIKNGWIKELTSTIGQAMNDAEKQFPEQGSGKKKKEYVLFKVKAKCEEIGIPYTILATLIGKLIDTIIKNYNVISK